MKPQIEEIIFQYLDTDKQKTVSDLAAWLRANKMAPSPEWAGETYNAFVNKCKGYIIHRTEIAKNGSWKIKLYLQQIKKYENVIISEGLQHIVWQHLKYCNEKCGTKCQPGCDLTILGKKFNGLCKDANINHFLRININNPGEEMLVKIKRLLELEQKARTVN